MRFFLAAGFLFSSLAAWGTTTVFQAHLLNYDVKYYWISLEAKDSSTYIKGHTTIGAQVTAAKMDTFAFQLHDNHTIDSVVINGTKYTSVKRRNGEVRVKLSMFASKGLMLNATIYYHGTAPTYVDNWSLGLVNMHSSGKGITYTLSVPYSAYHWFPCKQVMADLADSVYLDITVDTSLKVAGNGLLEGVTSQDSGKATWHWRTRYPINYYLICFAVGDYAEIKGKVLLPGEKDSLLIHNMVYDDPTVIAKGKYLLTRDAGDMLTNYSKLFGTYPFAKEKFGIYTVPLSGGMEHQTMPALGEVEFYLLAHEMAHQWFGDHVNLGTFRDMWLNEGWASYCEYLTAEKFRPTDTFTIMGNYHYDVLLSSQGSGYVSDTIKFNKLYNGTLVYHKGAAVLHTLRKVINNDSIFFGAVAEYQQKFGFKHARMQDFIDVMEEKSGMDLTQFFQQWYYGEGYPIFAPTWYQKNGKVKIKLVQTTSAPTKTPLFQTPVEIKFVTASGQARFRIEQVIGTQYYEIPFTDSVKNITIDPDNWLLNKSKPPVRDSSILSVPDIENKGEGMRVYPNPFNENLCIELPQLSRDTYVQLSSITGCEVTSLAPAQNHFTLETGGLTKGVYILSVRQNDSWQYRKVVKVH